MKIDDVEVGAVVRVTDGAWYDANLPTMARVIEVYKNNYPKELYVSFSGGSSGYLLEGQFEVVSEEEVLEKYTPEEGCFEKPFIYLKALRDFANYKKGQLIIPNFCYKLRGDRGWEVAFYGNSNCFYNWNSTSISGKFIPVGFDTEQDAGIPKVLKDWGANYAYLRRDMYLNSIGEFLLDNFHAEVTKIPHFRSIIGAFKPTASREIAGAIAIYQNREKKDKDISTRYSKIGRAFRAMFPDLHDSVIEKFADKYRELYPVNDYVLKVGSDAADFKKAYAGVQVACQNPYTTSSRKSLANSCMRYDFDNLPCHPTETYASGDFRIYWTETAKGLVGSRCVVHIPSDGKPQAGPIYGVCEHSINLIENALKEADADLYGSSCWEGAKLVHKPHKGGVIGPYIDGNYQNLRESNCGEFLIICDGGRNTYEASNYSGILGNSDYVYCTECDADVDDVFHDNDGNCLCESCYNENWRYCDEYNGTMPAEGGAFAYYSTSSRGGWFSQWVCEEALTEYYTYCEDEGEWFRNEFVVENADGNYVSHRAINEGTYGINAEDELAYPMDQLSEDKDGRLVTITWLEENGYQLNEAGEYEQKEAA